VREGNERESREPTTREREHETAEGNEREREHAQRNKIREMAKETKRQPQARERHSSNFSVNGERNIRFIEKRFGSTRV
jgi:hypothetical protein